MFFVWSRQVISQRLVPATGFDTVTVLHNAKAGFKHAKTVLHTISSPMPIWVLWRRTPRARCLQGTGDGECGECGECGIQWRTLKHFGGLKWPKLDCGDQMFNLFRVFWCLLFIYAIYVYVNLIHLDQERRRKVIWPCYAVHRSSASQDRACWHS